jgi:hypothetical protein
MFNPEREILRNLTIDQAHVKAQKVLGKDIIKPKQFSHLYDESMIEKDEALVAKRKAEFVGGRDPRKETVEKLAAVFEAVLHEEAELSEWLGPNVTTIKTSDFDDIVNGVDSVAEIREGEAGTSHLAFAIDVTFDENTEKKFERIKQEIDKGELAKVKYFFSQDTGFMGSLNMVPRVVVGAEPKTVEELSELWLERNNKVLGSHQIQFQILEEILIQLEAFEQYANRIKQFEVAGKYEKARHLIEVILSEKQGSLIDEGIRDSVFESIKGNLVKFD